MAKLPRPHGFVDPKSTPATSTLQAIGRVAVVSAGVEDYLHSIYWKLLGVSDDYGRVVTGDARPNRLTEDIRKLAKLRGLPNNVVEDLSDVLTFYKECAQKRNQCMHWLWFGTAVAPPTYKSGIGLTPFSDAEINALADDLAWIEVRLEAHCMEPTELRIARQKLGEQADLVLPAPWLRKQL